MKTTQRWLYKIGLTVLDRFSWSPKPTNQLQDQSGWPASISKLVDLLMLPQAGCWCFLLCKSMCFFQVFCCPHGKNLTISKRKTENKIVTMYFSSILSCNFSHVCNPTSPNGVEQGSLIHSVRGLFKSLNNDEDPIHQLSQLCTSENQYSLSYYSDSLCVLTRPPAY